MVHSFRLPPEVVSAIDSLSMKLDLKEESAAAAEIQDLLARTVLSGGKRFRPTLLLLTVSALGGKVADFIPFARAVELIHAATLAHDDVIDDSRMRRRRPTLNALASNSRAVLAGDYLLARVVAELSTLGSIKAIELLAGTVEALVEGEWLQMQLRGQLDVSLEQLEKISELKTSSLMKWCVMIPARLLGRPEAETALARLGAHLGLAFQLMDDVLDFEISSDKSYALDLQEGLMNHVLYEMLKNDPGLRAQVAPIFGQVWKGAPWSDQALLNAKNCVKARCVRELNQAKEQLYSCQFKKGEALEGFEELFDFLQRRVN